MQRIGGELYELLVSAVAQHGPEAVGQLRSDLEAEWGRIGSEELWPTRLRRRILIALRRAGVNRDWCKEQLVTLESQMLTKIRGDAQRVTCIRKGTHDLKGNRKELTLI